jgi:nucleotide-binding universal stress UspA family protein
MRKLLIPIDSGSSAARVKSAVAEAIAIYRREPVDIHLLSVQASVTSHVAMFFKSGELGQIQQQAGTEELAPAQAMLATAGVPHSSSVVVGRKAETIAKVARARGCDRIVMGQEAGAGLAGRIFGSLAGQVRQLVGGTSDCQVLGS